MERLKQSKGQKKEAALYGAVEEGLISGNIWAETWKSNHVEFGRKVFT